MLPAMPRVAEPSPSSFDHGGLGGWSGSHTRPVAITVRPEFVLPAAAGSESGRCRWRSRLVPMEPAGRQ